MKNSGHPPLRILLADTTANVRTALRLVIEHQSGLHVIGEATNAVHLLAQAADTRPDLILLDAELPGLALPRRAPLLSLRELLYALHKICPRASVIVLSSLPVAVEQVMQSSADAFFCKSDPPDALLTFLKDKRKETNP